jgi:hypothetical protein
MTVALGAVTMAIAQDGDDGGADNGRDNTPSMGGDDPPSLPPTTTAPNVDSPYVPDPNGYIWYSGPPDGPPHMPPNTGGSVGVQYPPNQPTITVCNQNGVQVPCK